MWYQLARPVVRLAFRSIWPTTVTGVENVPRTGGVLIASNHLAFLDSIVIPAVMPREVKFIAKNEYFTGTGVRGAFDRVFFTAVGAVGVDRSSSSAATDALDVAADILDRGLAFGIYPEGTRSRTGLVYRGRTGVAWLSLAKNVPVVPVGVVGTNKAQNITDNSLRPFQPLGVHFGKPIHPHTYASRKPAVARRDLTDDVMDAIAGLSGQQRSGEYAPRGG